MADQCQTLLQQTRQELRAVRLRKDDLEDTLMERDQALKACQDQVNSLNEQLRTANNRITEIESSHRGNDGAGSQDVKMEEASELPNAGNATIAELTRELNMCCNTLSKVAMVLGLPNNSSLDHIVETAQGTSAHIKSLQSQIESANGTEKALRGQMKQQGSSMGKLEKEIKKLEKKLAEAQSDAQKWKAQFQREKISQGLPSYPAGTPHRTPQKTPQKTRSVGHAASPLVQHSGSITPEMSQKSPHISRVASAMALPNKSIAKWSSNAMDGCDDDEEIQIKKRPLSDSPLAKRKREG